MYLVKEVIITTAEGSRVNRVGQKQDPEGLYVLAIYIDQRIHRLWPPLLFPLLQHAVQRFLEPHLGRGGAVCAAIQASASSAVSFSRQVMLP